MTTLVLARALHLLYTYHTLLAHSYYEDILFLRDIHTRSWYDHAGVFDTVWFQVCFHLYVQYSLCHGMDIGTCGIVRWSAAPHDCIANRTGFLVYVVLVLNVIRYSCHYFLDRILFHHDCCDYHWDFYGYQLPFDQHLRLPLHN